MQDLISTTTEQTMSSREIAEVTGKRQRACPEYTPHDHRPARRRYGRRVSRD
jgi:hypothetical protein